MVCTLKTGVSTRVKTTVYREWLAEKGISGDIVYAIRSHRQTKIVNYTSQSGTVVGRIFILILYSIHQAFY